MSESGNSITLESPGSRAGLIAERQRHSLLWRLIHQLGSLKLALVLLATIAIACAVATFTESRFDSAVARAWIYKAPWFVAWLGILCINLFAVTLTRWPWQKKHAGFIITHYGIILLLIGAVVGSKLGFEGNVTLRTDGQPERRVVTDRSTLQVESPADGYLYLLPFDTRFLRPSANKPLTLRVPGTTLKIIVDSVSEHLVAEPRIVKSLTGPENLAVLLGFSSGMMRQSLHIGLGTAEGVPRTNEFFGRADITLVKDAASLPHHDGSKKKPWLDLIPERDPDTLFYRLGRGDTVSSSGILKTGGDLPLGWADWHLSLLGVSVGGTIVSGNSPAESGGVPGFHAYLMSHNGQRGEPAWIASGEVVPLMLNSDFVRLGYGLELKQIPFSVALKNFEVPRDEGTDTPSDFRATLEFKNLKNGDQTKGLVRMNHPASYPGGLFANITGLNYKFSQAEWNPQDLRETTLQVLYDPGWIFKWIGSLAICLGIATMFYIRPRS